MMEAFMNLVEHLIGPPHMVIGDPENPYVWRWRLFPEYKLLWWPMPFNIYLHKFWRSDDDRALHDHPWFNISMPLTVGYWEHVPRDGDMQKTVVLWRKPFHLYVRTAETMHRIELSRTQEEFCNCHFCTKEIPCWSLFFTGRKTRSWGFYCPKGWVYWENFVSKYPGGNAVGKGCDQ